MGAERKVGFEVKVYKCVCIIGTAVVIGDQRLRLYVDKHHGVVTVTGDDLTG